MDVKQALETIISALPNKHAFTEEIKTLEALAREPLTVEEALKEFEAKEWKITKMPEGCYELYHLRSKGHSTEITILKDAAYEVTVPGSKFKQLISFEEHQLLHKLLKAMKREESDE